ncbi:TPA: hypothetical protein ACHJQ2_005372, partial [Escherichia coli]
MSTSWCFFCGTILPKNTPTFTRRPFSPFSYNMRGSRCISRVWNDLQDEDTDGESGMNLSGINGYLA